MKPSTLLQTPPDTPVDCIIKATNEIHRNDSKYDASFGMTVHNGSNTSIAGSTLVKNSASYKSSEHVSISLSQEQKTILHQGTCSFGDVLTQVPWMKFRVVAEPNVDVFASDIRLQTFIRQITELTVSIVTKQCSEEIAVLVAALVASMSKSMTARVSLLQETIIDQIAALRLADTMTGENTLNIIEDQFCVGPIRSNKPAPPCIPEDPHPKVPIPQDRHLDVTKANWIWTEEAKYKKLGQPYFTRPFRKVVKCDEYVDRLTIAIACEDKYTLYVNGCLVGSGENRSTPDRYTVEFDAAKQVVIAVYASDDTGGTAVGLLACGKVWNSRDEHTKEVAFITDKSWKTHPGNFKQAFVQTDFKDAAAWEQAHIVATYEGASWRSEMKEVQEGKMVHSRWSGRFNIADAPEAPLAKVCRKL